MHKGNTSTTILCRRPVEEKICDWWVYAIVLFFSIHYYYPDTF